MTFEEFAKKDKKAVDKASKCKNIDEFKKFATENTIEFTEDELKQAWLYVRIQAGEKLLKEFAKEDKEAVDRALKCKNIDEFKKLAIENEIDFTEEELKQAWLCVQGRTCKKLFGKFIEKDEEAVDKILKCENIDEFRKLAIEDKIDFTEDELEQAWDYVQSQIHGENGEIDEGALGAVAGGGSEFSVFGDVHKDMSKTIDARGANIGTVNFS